MQKQLLLKKVAYGFAGLVGMPLIDAETISRP
jgi:hypothetical protein